MTLYLAKSTVLVVPRVRIHASSERIPPAAMATAPMIIQVRSGLARPPETLSCSTSAWNSRRRGVSGSLAAPGVSVAVMVLLCSRVGRGRGAEVGGGELLGNLVRWSGSGDAAAQHDRRDRRHSEHGLGELLDDENGQPLTGEVGNPFVELLDDERRQAHRQLVEQQQRRARCQRPRDGEHLLLTARECAGELAAALPQ